MLKLINPVNHGSTAEEIAIYKTESYVMAGDVYGVKPDTGRGGWTWYTGSPGWMYQLITEWVLGMQKEAGKLQFKPCIPKEWETIKMNYRYMDTVYLITVWQKKGNSAMTVVLDGLLQNDGSVTLNNDCVEHTVTIEFAMPLPATNTNAMLRLPEPIDIVTPQQTK